MKLLPPSDYGEGDSEGPSIACPKIVEKDYVGESRHFVLSHCSHFADPGAFGSGGEYNQPGWGARIEGEWGMPLAKGVGGIEGWEMWGGPCLTKVVGVCEGARW